jgi:hypothetical protein
MRTTRVLIAACLVLASYAIAVPAARAAPGDPPCRRGHCPEVATGQGSFTASYMEQTPGGWVASNGAPAEHPYTYRLSHPCVVDDRETQTCRASDFRECPAPPDRVIEDLVIEQRRLVITDPAGTGTTTVDGFPAAASPVGTPVGPWMSGARGCIDITALNPPPSPAEVFRYFQTLPLPQLATRQQPPGNGLVGLPVIFYTDSPITRTFALTIRGFTVDIVAGATAFTWHTGDGTHLTTTDPGAPYPDQTVTHDYRSGTYTAYLTTTWGATFSVNGGPAVAVPGTATTDGPPVTFAVLQARPVLTNPYD